MNTREQWLLEATSRISNNIFKPKGLNVPNVKVSIGFTSGKGSKAIGAHWAPTAAKDGIGQIYIVPTRDDSVDILAILTHELVHASVGNEQGHGKMFKRAALSVGLEGKMRATVAGKELTERLNALVKEIGPIPHAQLNQAQRPTKKQTTRLLKAICEDSEYTVRITKTWIESHGAPICPCCNEAMNIIDKQ